jgi:hypothetical protein
VRPPLLQPQLVEGGRPGSMLLLRWPAARPWGAQRSDSVAPRQRGTLQLLLCQDLWEGTHGLVWVVGCGFVGCENRGVRVSPV